MKFRRFRSRSAAALAAGLLMCSVSRPLAQSTDQAFLRVKSPFAGQVWRADVSDDENHIAVSSAYDSVSTWAVDTPDAPLIARVPLRNEERKRAHAVALDPAGGVIAYSVPPVATEPGTYRPGSSVIYLLRRSNGAILRVLDQSSYDIATRPQAMRFSPDGAHLAAVLSSGCGLRVWSTRTWELVARDDIGYGGVPGEDACCRSGNIDACDRLPNSNSLVFFRDDRTGESQLITSGDTGVRAYALIGDRIEPPVWAQPEQLDLDRPAGLSLSPNGRSLVIGDRRAPSTTGRLRFRAALVDRKNLRPLRPPLEVTEAAVAFGGILEGGTQLGDLHQFGLDRVAWLGQEGRDYIFTGSLPCWIARIPPRASDREICLLRWTLDNPIPEFIPSGIDRARDLLALPRRGGILVVSPTLIALLDASGAPLVSDLNQEFVQRNTTADLRGSELEFSISPDAHVVRFEEYQGDSRSIARKTFNVRHIPQPLSSADSQALQPPNPDPNIVEGWRNGRDPRIAGQPLPSSEAGKDEAFRSATVLYDKNLVLLGSSDFLRVISYANGAPVVACRESIAEEAFRVNFSTDGNFAVSAHGDGTIRWYRIAWDGSSCSLTLQLSARFAQPPAGGAAWVAWRPDGRHAQDVAMREGLEWQTHDSAGGVLRTPFERLQSWYDPNAIKTALDMPLQKRTDILDISRIVTRASRQPVIELVNPRGRADKPFVSLGLRFTTVLDKPRLLTVRVNNTPAAIEWQGATYTPGRELTVTADRLVQRRLELTVALSANARTIPGEFQICFYLDGIRDRCHVMAWAGELVKPAKRRLWAVFVAVARHTDQSLDLKFADNDVLDLARVFTADHEQRTRVPPAAVIPADFQEININLAIAGSPEAEKEADSLASTYPYVKRFGATKLEIMAAIQDVIRRRAASPEGSDLGDDLFVFHFSGHGIIAPTEKDQGRTLFATQETRRDAALLDNDPTTLASLELLDLFESMPGEKLVVFDACRTLSQAPESAIFDPNYLISDLKTHALSADVFFSSDARQPSREVPGLAFDASRPQERLGNGLFTYALLRGLTTDGTQLPGERGALVSVRVRGLAHYFDTVFFNPALHDGEASRLMKQYGWNTIQTPRFYPMRESRPGTSIVRTFVQAAESRP